MSRLANYIYALLYFLFVSMLIFNVDIYIFLKHVCTCKTMQDLRMEWTFGGHLIQPPVHSRSK